MKKLAPATVTTYKAALARPLKLAFNVDVSDAPFGDFVKGLYNIRPSKPLGNIQWSLDRALSLLLSNRFQQNPSVIDSFYMSVFLLALATGNRVSEIHALLREDQFLEFSSSGVLLSPNPNFLAKNESPSNRRSPIFIPRLSNEDGSPHPLCPVNSLSVYLSLTARTRSFKLFVDPRDLSDLSIHKLRLYLCKFIRISNPGSFPKTHDLRKLATSYAFFNHMSSNELCDVVGWSSIRVFYKHYLKRISELSSSVVMLGKILPSNFV